MSDPSGGVDYARLVSDALLAVVRQILHRVSEHGLPGSHYFYITFDTSAEGVELAPTLRARYPEEMTIVLQHQFQDLQVEGDAFAVTLRFAGEPRRLRVPWTAVRSFVDPGAEIGFRFGGPDAGEPAGIAETAGPTAADNVVPLSHFRRRRESKKE